MTAAKRFPQPVICLTRGEEERGASPEQAKIADQTAPRGGDGVLEVAGRLVVEAPSQLRVDLTQLMMYRGRSLLVLDLRGVSRWIAAGSVSWSSFS